MTKSAKIISLFLCVAMVFSLVGAMVISSFAAETPTITVSQVSNDGKTIVLTVAVTKGYVNAVDLKFSMSGLTCKAVKDQTGKGQGNANPGTASHYSAASTEPITGTLAKVTLEITNKDKYSFSVNATECGVTENIKYDENDNIISVGDTVKVTPTIKGNINYEKTPTSSSTSTTKSTTSTTKSTTKSTTSTTKSTTSTTKTTTSTTKSTTSTTTDNVPTNTLPSSTEASTSEVISSVEDTTTDFSYDYDDNTYDYYTPEDDETEPAGSDEFLDGEKDPKTIIIVAAIAVVLVAGAAVAFVVINKKKNAG